MSDSREERYIAHWPIGYGDKQLDRGEVFELQGLPNDSKLIRLGYIAELSKGDVTYECGECGRAFVGTTERTAHGRLRHQDRELTPEQEDAEFDRQEKQLLATTPLKLENTAASRK